MPLGDGIRRNIALVDASERALLRDALLEMDRRVHPGALTDSPPGGVSWWLKVDEVFQHGAGGDLASPPVGLGRFVAWNRKFVNWAESRLRAVDGRLSLHYWDWRHDPRALPLARLSDGGRGLLNLFTPEFMGSPWETLRRLAPVFVAGPGRVLEPPDSGSDGGLFVDVSYLTAVTTLEVALHNVARFLGARVSGRDPFFLLVLANVDRLLTEWWDRNWRTGAESRSFYAGARFDLDAALPPWSGEPPVVRPWAPPEHERDLTTYLDRALLEPPRYDSHAPVVSAPFSPFPPTGFIIPVCVADRRGAPADLFWFRDDGVWRAHANPDGTFEPGRRVLDAFGRAGGWNIFAHSRCVADLTGEGHADIVGFGNAGVATALAGADDRFSEPRLVLEAFAPEAGGWSVYDHPRMLADLTGDGRADIVAFGEAGVWTALGRGDGSFRDPQLVHAGFAPAAGGWRRGRHPRMVADLTGDGRADIIAFGEAGVWTATGRGDGWFDPPRLVVDDFCPTKGWSLERHLRVLADLRGIGRSDIVGFGESGVIVALSNGDGTFHAPARVLPDHFCAGAGWWDNGRTPRFVADITGNGHADIVGFADAGVWVALGRGDGTFERPELVLERFGWPETPLFRTVARVTGRRAADLLAIFPTRVEVWSA